MLKYRRKIIFKNGKNILNKSIKKNNIKIKSLLRNVKNNEIKLNLKVEDKKKIMFIIFMGLLLQQK